MKLKFVAMILPYFLKYTDDLPEGSGGIAKGPFVRIRPKYKDDKGLHVHEEEHVWQFYVTLGLHNILYDVSDKYQKWSEAQAYGAQYAAGADLDKMVRRMMSDIYDYTVTEDKARALIKAAAD